MAQTTPGLHHDGCAYPDDHLPRHPCGKPYVPGAPCQFCGVPTPLDGTMCATCWRPVTIADFKGLCAEAGMDTVVTLAEQP